MCLCGSKYSVRKNHIRTAISTKSYTSKLHHESKIKKGNRSPLFYYLYKQRYDVSVCIFTLNFTSFGMMKVSKAL